MNASLYFTFTLGCLSVNALLATSPTDNNWEEQPSVSANYGFVQEILHDNDQKPKHLPQLEADTFTVTRG